MAYTVINFKTKKEVREAIKRGDKIRVYQPGPFAATADIRNGTVYLEGPHYPQPHKWYAEGTMHDGFLIRIT